MNKGQGATAGALVLAGLLVHPFATLAPSASPASGSDAPSAISSLANEDPEVQGPWIASCNYWAPSRASHNEKATPPETSLDLRIESQRFHLNETASAHEEASCMGSGDRWGIPAGTGPNKPRITAIIATVPDPLHAHISLEFDRTIDSLLQAAADNDYVESYYWLPWKKRESTAIGRVLLAETKQEHERERRPGLIILKYVPNASDKASKAWSGYNRVIYLFLVAETPALGVNGSQLQNAFRYERELQIKLGQSKSKKDDTGLKLSLDRIDRDKSGHLAIIGPQFSGSAASMRVGLERAAFEQFEGERSKTKRANVKRTNTDRLLFNHVDMAGATGTALASDILNRPSKLDKSGVKICYRSFGHNSTFERTQMIDFVANSGHNTSRVAFLIEGGTVFGASEARPKAKVTNKKPQSLGKEESPKKDRRINDTFMQPETVKTFPPPVTIRFPRGISLLRNAHQEDLGQSGGGANLAPSPYLHLSLHDSSVEETVSTFSATHTPLSQESQLYEIARQLQRYRVQFICILATDVLDQIFLSQFLHREVPDARLVVMGGGDLLFEHGTDNVPFIGALTITPYNLIAPVASTKDKGAPQRSFASADEETTYNAASFTFWDGKDEPKLANYRNVFDPTDVMHASLWATAIGRDGYYPVGIVNQCASNSSSILPSFQAKSYAPGKCAQPAVPPKAASDGRLKSFGEDVKGRVEALRQRRKDLVYVLLPQRAQEWWGQEGLRFPVSPSLLWLCLCGLISGGCIFHIACLGFADFWSPFTRDLAIDQNDEPSRRALYIHIGTVMLFCMAFVVAYPIFPALRILRPLSSSLYAASLTILVAIAAVIYSFLRTWRYALRKHAAAPECDGTDEEFPSRIPDIYRVFHVIAFAAMVLIPLTWVGICGSGGSGPSPSHVGLFFSYRCLNPASGVSPLIPVLLLLFSWYLWSVFQTRRLRFSETSRPRLPGRINSSPLYQLFVSDDDLDACETSTRPALYRNITCLLITREVFDRFFRKAGWKVPVILFTAYLVLFLLCVYGVHVEAMDRLFWKVSYWPTPYEGLVEVLFFPLLMIGLSGWLRMVLIWGALRRGLLKRLEERPIRTAFCRLDKMGWMSMMRQGDMHERSREMARSMESMRQMLNNRELVVALASHGQDGETIHGSYGTLTAHLEQLFSVIQRRVTLELNAMSTPEERFAALPDIPDWKHRNELLLTYLIENDYAEFSKRLLERVLIPYWENKNSGLVEGEDARPVAVHARRILPEAGKSDELALQTGPAEEEPAHVRLAEEFVAIRYVSLIRAVLVNVRHLMTFVTCAFVLSIVAWNSYPFQPREWIDAAFTVLLVCMGSGIVWVLAQIHRDPILSRITKTNANELGVDFYIRIATFGALPVLTWLAYQFPIIGSSILRYFQPGLQAMK